MPDGRHGGWRPGAGRPKRSGAVSHDARPSEPSRFPQHVTLRIADGVSSLARDGLMKIIRRVRNVLLNRKHHDAEKKFAKFWIDPYSSAAWFDGPTRSVRTRRGSASSSRRTRRPRRRRCGS